MSRVELRGVTRRFGKVTAVDALELDIAAGECFSLLGPSGCGKTTTLRMVAGFEDLDEGEIVVGGRTFSSKAANTYLPPEKRGFGMVFQAFAVWPHLSVRENVAFPLRLRRLPDAEIDRRTLEALAHTGLLDAAAGSPDDLSGGGKQRVALARALAINPGVMLLDEPLSSLDPHLREEMRFEIKDLQRIYGFTILYVTHDQSEAMALSDRILVMRAGVAEQVGTPLEVYTAPASRFVFGFIGLSNFLEVELSGGAARAGGEAFRPDAGPPAELSAAGRAVLASRPSEIAFVDEGGLPARVVRRTFLGESVDYGLRLPGGQELRVQAQRGAPGPREGEACRVAFRRPAWYPAQG
ncbi:sn-glycerol-3-phosphate import ATP-binding protein UgpC [Fundidesulfovibrio magnetotacticus]|uniref:sn-glycerol-3-phosphate import ATP-binding protein UgpC n=1 Tax=Fundidesulfovibrio magnetotacticus TaxID=2730080 RepID=A0A6V8LTE3_9BACT|nr:ABC transporter ATP-binding protein [Fundidesulfovibrio magnetotacticus]GFK94210.1 sn-glycerol-3-phosphate import ATP-binding protein UgpC [Fundidesulfovibrio magnetotacticus]